MNNAQMTARVGLFFILGLALVWVVFESLGTGALFRDKGYQIATRFDDLQQLKTGDEVRIAGVQVGTVSTTRLAEGRAEAVMMIDPGVAIPSDSHATISMSGLLGNNYLSIVLGTSPTSVGPDGVLASEKSPDINSILSKLDSLGDDLQVVMAGVTKAFGGQEDGLFQRLDGLIARNSENFTRTVENLEAITVKINNREGTLGRLLNDSAAYDELIGSLSDFRKAAAEANAFITEAQGMMAQIKSGEGTLGALIYDEKTGNDIRTTARNLRDLSEKLNSGQGTIGKLLTDDTLYRDAQGILRKADRALDGLADQGPITAVGVAANALF